MKKVLLVGVGGYIGDKFKQYMQIYPEYDISEVSSMNRDWDKISFTSFDVVYNVSGLAHANARKGTEEQYYAINGQLPIDVAAKAKAEGVCLFVQMSSMIVYGDISPLGKKKNINRETVPSQPSIYGKSKMMAEDGLHKLEDATFNVAIIRTPLVYSENARDNFPRLVNFAKKSPIFPNLKNNQSMVYVDNLCELVHLIIENNQGGTYYPQQKEYIETSKIVRDIAKSVGNHMWQTTLFNPFIRLFSKRISFIQKAFGNITYDKSISNHFDWKYVVVDYEESIERIAKTHLKV
jgi:UDP-glucose 4-epimerase